MKTIMSKMLFVALLVAFVASAVYVQPASAGTNGQQIEVRSYVTSSDNSDGYKALRVKISGKNQYGQILYYDSGAFSPVYSKQITGKWWVGSVSVEINFKDLKTGKVYWRSCLVNVPKTQINSNFTIVMFDYTGCWKK